MAFPHPPTPQQVLDKPPPFDRLRRDELETAIGACRLAQPRNQRTVEELLARKAHSYMAWDREVLPALKRFDEATISEWIVRDRPLPGDVSCQLRGSGLDFWTSGTGLARRPRVGRGSLLCSSM